MKSIIVTTTNNIEGATILKYMDLVAANVVVGTHFFSDFAASFTDLFGGYSNTYQRKLDNIYEIAIDGLKKKAQYISADAVIGMKIDFSEISGKGKSMFMVSAVGMAVKLKYEDNTETNNIESAIASQEMLSMAVLRHVIIENANNGQLPDEAQWAYLFNEPIEDIVPFLLEKYCASLNNFDLSTTETLLQNNFLQYIGLIDRDVAVKVLYSNISKRKIDFIKENKLFDPKAIMTLLENGDLHNSVLCLAADKQYYTTDDLLAMEEIVRMFDALPDRGRNENVKGLFKESEKYICEKGHKNSLDAEFCCECGLNIKGLVQTEVKALEDFKLKVRLLKELL